MKEFILQENLRPGDKLPTEEVLVARLQVGRGAVREALRSMEALGMIEARQGSGRVVREFNFMPILDNLSYGLAFQNRSILQITEVRKALEMHLVAEVVERVSTAWIAELDVRVDEIRASVKAKCNYRDADYRFHRKLLEAAGNELALQLFEISWNMKFRAIDASATQWAPTTHEVKIHANIVSAIRSRDVARARMAVAAHFADSEARLQARMVAEHGVKNGFDGRDERNPAKARQKVLNGSRLRPSMAGRPARIGPKEILRHAPRAAKPSKRS